MEFHPYWQTRLIDNNSADNWISRGGDLLAMLRWERILLHGTHGTQPMVSYNIVWHKWYSTHGIVYYCMAHMVLMVSSINACHRMVWRNMPYKLFTQWNNFSAWAIHFAIHNFQRNSLLLKILLWSLCCTNIALLVSEMSNVLLVHVLKISIVLRLQCTEILPAQPESR